MQLVSMWACVITYTHREYLIIAKNLNIVKSNNLEISAKKRTQIWPNVSLTMNMLRQFLGNITAMASGLGGQISFNCQPHDEDK